MQTADDAERRAVPDEFRASVCLATVPKASIFNFVVLSKPFQSVERTQEAIAAQHVEHRQIEVRRSQSRCYRTCGGRHISGVVTQESFDKNRKEHVVRTYSCQVNVKQLLLCVYGYEYYNSCKRMTTTGS